MKHVIEHNAARRARRLRTKIEDDQDTQEAAKMVVAEISG